MDDMKTFVNENSQVKPNKTTLARKRKLTEIHQSNFDKEVDFIDGELIETQFRKMKQLKVKTDKSEFSDKQQDGDSSKQSLTSGSNVSNLATKKTSASIIDHTNGLGMESKLTHSLQCPIQMPKSRAFNFQHQDNKVGLNRGRAFGAFSSNANKPIVKSVSFNRHKSSSDQSIKTLFNQQAN